MRRVVSPTTVGRTREYEQILTALREPPVVVAVDGEEGIGKTRLVSDLLARPELDGHRRLRGRCPAIRDSFSLGPVIEALRGAGRALAERTLSPVAGALRPLLPELGDVLPATPEPTDDRAAARHRVFRAMVEVLAALGRSGQGGTVLVLEDLHEADEQTIDFLGYLLADMPGRLALLATYRGEELGPRPRALVTRPDASADRLEISLRPLDEAETGRLAAAILSEDEREGRLPADFAAHLWARTSGVPFAIEEVLALLRTRGSLPFDGSGRWDHRTLEDLDVPSGIRAPVLERVSRLSVASREVVEAAAVLAGPTLRDRVPPDILAATCRTAQARASAAVDEAVRSALLTETGDGIGFRHPLAARAVYDSLRGPRRRDLHARAARASATIDPVPLARLAHHQRLAGRLTGWAQTAERAADLAFELGHDAEACRLLEDVVRHAPLEPTRRARLAIRLGQVGIEALRPREVVEPVSAVPDADLPADLRAELRFRLGLLLHEIGDDPPRMRRLMLDAVDGLGHRPELRAWAMVVLGIPTGTDDRPGEHQHWLTRAADLIPTIDDPVFEVFLHGKVAMLMVPFGDRTWRDIVDRIERRTGGTPRHRREVNAYWSVGAEACYTGHHELARRLLTTGSDGAIAGRHHRLEVSLRSALMLLDFCTGESIARREALTEIGELVERLADHPRARIDAEVAAGGLALANGDLQPARQALTRAVDQCYELGGLDALPIPAAALIRADLAAGDRDAAVTHAERLVETVESKGCWATDVRMLPAIIEAVVGGGRSDDVRRASDFLAGCETQLRDVDAPLAPAALAHAHAYLRRADGDRPAAARLFTEAAEHYDAATSPYEAALAVEQAALADPDGPGSLPEVLMRFRRLDATWDAARVAQLARERGVPVPARHRGGRRGYGRELSPREREVAELASRGRSNKQIAAELFLSVHTVSRHISAAMRKLEVHSRTALAHRLTESETASLEQN